MVASVEALAASTQALIADMEALAANVEALTANSTKFRRQMDQLPWVRVNSRPGDWGTLHNPTSIFPLTEPNPRNSEELLKFTGESQAGAKSNTTPLSNYVPPCMQYLSVLLQLRVWGSLLCHRISLFMSDEDR